MKCEYCGTVIPDGAEECPACGAGIELQTKKPADGENASGRKTIKCRKCKTENDITMKFCGHCGEELDPDSVSDFVGFCLLGVPIFMGWVAYKVWTAYFGGVPHGLLWWVLTVIIVVAASLLCLCICCCIFFGVFQSEKKEDN